MSGPGATGIAGAVMSRAEWAAAYLAELPATVLAAVVHALGEVVIERREDWARGSVRRRGGVATDEAADLHAVGAAVADPDGIFARSCAPTSAVLVAPLGVVVVEMSDQPVVEVVAAVLSALATRNAVVVSVAGARGSVVTDVLTELARAAQEVGAPAGSLQYIDEIDGWGGHVGSDRRTAFVVSSPGAGAVPVYVGERTDLGAAAEAITSSASRHNGWSRWSESVVIVASQVADDLRRELVAAGGTWVATNTDDSLRTLARSGTLAAGSSATDVAERLSVAVNPGSRLLLVALEAMTDEDPFCGPLPWPVLPVLPVAGGGVGAARALRGAVRIAGGAGPVAAAFADGDDLNAYARAAAEAGFPRIVVGAAARPRGCDLIVPSPADLLRRSELVGSADLTSTPTRAIGSQVVFPPYPHPRTRRPS